nr:hypothetical protein [Deltaproteobacteria bacterium]
MMKGLRIPMFVKFLVGCLLLASFLIIGSTYVFEKETRLRARGNFLAKSVRRLHGYTERVGRGMTGQVELLASDTELRRAFTPDRPPPPVDPKAEPVAAPAARPDAAARAAQMYEHLMGKNGLKPDLFAVFTPNNKLIYKSPGTPFTEADLPELAVIEKVRSGSVFAHNFHMLAGQPYQVSGVPLRIGDQVMAGIVAGVKLERYFAEWSEQTDDDAQMRMRPLLIEGLNVLAAAWPAERRADVARALAPDRVVRVKVGEDERDVAQLATAEGGDKTTTGDFDFFGEELEGYKKNDAGTLGKLYIIRSRANVQNPATTPWEAILVGVGASLLIAFLMGFWVTRPIKQ